MHTPAAMLSALIAKSNPASRILAILILSTIMAACQSTQTILLSDGTPCTITLEDDGHHGHGRCEYQHGQVYEGDFLDGEFSGFGMYSSSCGTYQGQFLNGKKHGLSVYDYGDGHIFKGRHAHGVVHGYGELISPDKGVISGWLDSWRDGTGVWRLPDGTVYVGQFKDEKRNGQGQITYPNGTRYFGTFKNDRPHGQGTLTLPDGRIAQGVFENGKRSAFLTITSPSGTVCSWEIGSRAMECPAS